MVMALRRLTLQLGSRHSRRGTRGFTLIEALIATAIVVVIALGLIPLFTRAMANNMAGSDSTFVSTAGQSGIETVISIPFGHPTQTLVGAATATTPVVETYRQGDPTQLGDLAGGWGGTSGTSLWSRTTTVRQYNVTSDLDDDQTLNTPEPGSIDPTFVHLKEVEVRLDSGRTSGILTGKTITLHYFRAQ